VCVNGGGKFGCMGSLNDGCNEAGGKVVGVIHEMFLLDGAEHFDPGAPNAKNTTLLVATGDDLQERKRLLVEGCDGIIVLPGGTGTWDELWEMACQKNLGLFDKAIVCVNVDGFYDDFRRMLERAERDTLMRLKASEVLHFAATAEDALAFLEAEVVKEGAGREAPVVARKKIPVGAWQFAAGMLTGVAIGLVAATRIKGRR
jgi:uncharacterized protein (TIGR00730 family)